MQRIPAKIPTTVLPTSAAAIYTVGGNKLATISALSVCNTTGNAVTLTIYLGSAADAGHTLVSSRSLSANETFQVSSAIGMTLLAGETIQAIASAATSLTLHGAVYETTI